MGGQEFSTDRRRPFDSLRLFCWFSVCSLEEFASLHTSIPLETLMITHATEVIASPESALLARVTTLQLNSCRSLKFSRLPRSLKLRRLILYENEVMDMVCLMAEGTHMLEELEELFLTNSNGIGRRDFEFDQFIASIRKMTHLRVLQLCQQLSERIGIPTFNGFPEALPQTVECLRIWGPLGTITDSDPWVEKVRGKTWLPNLREFALMQDMPTGDHSAWLWARAPWERTDSAGEQTATLDRVSREIIEAMVQYRPQVKITCARH
ncbi:hypothetical protein DACRYDRAFT_22908 [Dacryopinax primogenitus]|uniref:F-box domain-containing protein n=1 Tax=Dacryopinax primogenitus (strain DJM 731) TaxID=1858805 RepID=M5FXE1_DACPD|nr:uncharacterized protein DACRYDRAFT_22908 [Dacryopinax primogenitus]EJU01134.1 hypothetical protein DACRYDRAFT_22908 [Dacryopinax primogenitus]